MSRKRYTSKERLGLLMVFLITILLTGGILLLDRCSVHPADTSTIEVVNGSQPQDSVKNKKGRKKKGGKGKRHSRKRVHDIIKTDTTANRRWLEEDL